MQPHPLLWVEPLLRAVTLNLWLKCSATCLKVCSFQWSLPRMLEMNRSLTRHRQPLLSKAVMTAAFLGILTDVTTFTPEPPLCRQWPKAELSTANSRWVIPSVWRSQCEGVHTIQGTLELSPSSEPWLNLLFPFLQSADPVERKEASGLQRVTPHS